MVDEGTAALPGLAGVSNLLFSAGSWRTGRFALPLGTVLPCALAYWAHGDLLYADADHPN